jgi:hypothetical protein
MSKIEYHEDIKILKKSVKSRIKSIFIFFLFVFIVVGCFFTANYLSSALTVGNLGGFLVYGDTSLKIEKKSLWAVVMGEYSSLEEAEKVSLGAMVRGAGGYIWHEGSYFVIGNIYPNMLDAEKVLQNLKDSSYDIKIKEIVFPKLTLDFDAYENTDMGVIKKSIFSFDEVYESLYEMSIKLDMKEITNYAVSSMISDKRGEIKSRIVSIQSLINTSDNYLGKIQEYLVKLDTLLDATIIKTIDGNVANYSLKYAITEVVRLKYDLYNAL